MNDSPLKVLFIGAFKQSADDGTVGGQGFACQSLLNSALSDETEWVLIDSTQKSQPPPNLPVRTFYAIKRVLKALWYLMTAKVDTVLIFSNYLIASFAEKGLIALMARMFGKRVVYAIRSEVRPLPSDRWANGFRKMVVSSCTTIICQNHANVKSLEARFGKHPNKYVVVPNWVDIKQYESDSSKAIASQLNSTESPKPIMRFMYLGWLIKNKGIYELIDAVKILNEQSLPFHISICGGGDLLEELQTEVETLDLPQITFRGWVTGTDKVDRLHQSDVLVLPSYSEGMPNAVLEGMSAGLAVVATRVGGIPDLIRSDMQGILVPPRDAHALAEAMKECIENPEIVRQMGAHNQQHVRNNHHLDVVIPHFSKALGAESS